MSIPGTQDTIPRRVPRAGVLLLGMIFVESQRASGLASLWLHGKYLIFLTATEWANCFGRKVLSPQSQVTKKEAFAMGHLVVQEYKQ